LFEHRADASHNKIALACGDERMTYGELERRANQLARLLRSQGVRRGDCVGLWLPRSLDAHVALLGILKSGAAYVPLDPEFPAERVNFILSDCQARALVTTSELASKVGQASRLSPPASAPFRGEVFTVDKLQRELATQSADRMRRAEADTTPEDLCYVIYTSGTTGRPKGVEIEHRSACHLVRAEGKLFQVQPSDRVYQGFSLAFDASVEEAWLAFFAGATLVVGTKEMIRSGPALSRMLADAGVTVLSCVPTLLSMMDEDVPTVRLLILGGETCPPDLVKRWWRAGRRVFNTYGPTEATVIATYAECCPGELVTIGQPVPNYLTCILDEQLRPVPAGTPGELCLGGIGLARGYLGRPELTREKFISLTVPALLNLTPSASEIPKDPSPLPSPHPMGRGRPPGRVRGDDGPCTSNDDKNLSSPLRFYRTGDLARWTPDGSKLEFLGRIDTQVKIRGFRVELGEIESVLLQCPGVKAAAVSLREDVPGVRQLVAYLVPQPVTPFDEKAVRARLHAHLPAYMVPALLETHPQLPTLASGKVDRKSLPAPRARTAQDRPDQVPPRTDLEKQIVAVWEKLLAPTPVFLHDDFFRDLGGDSLTAALMVSELRRSPALRKLSMLDVYQQPTVERLAALFAHPQTREGERPHESKLAPKSGLAGTLALPAEVPFWRHFFCGAAQFVSLFCILSFFALQWLAPYLTYTVLIEEDYDFLESILGAFASLIVLYPLMLVIPIAVKWIMIGRYRPGAYPLWGTFYFRWWFTTTIEAAVPVGYLTGTPLLNIYLRLMGAKIGPNVHLDSDSFAIYDLLSIGEDSSINADSNLLGYTIENGQLKIGRITVGKRCFVGARCAVCEDSVMEDDSALEDLSLLPRGTAIPRGETWLGSPARQVVGQASRPPSAPLAPEPCTLHASRCSPPAVPFPSPPLEERDRERRPSFSTNMPVLAPQPSGRSVESAALGGANGLLSPALSSKGGEGEPSSRLADALKPSRPSAARRFLFGVLHGIGLLIFPVLVVSALFPGIVVMNELNYLDPYYWYLLLAPLVGLSFIVLLALEIALVKWVLLGRVKPGRHPLHSFYYLRKWFADQTLDLSLDTLGPLYASVYLTPWYKLLGARLGHGAEVSTASFISPDLLSIGDESFIADSVSLGAPRVRDGFMTLGLNHIGKRSFIGNSAMLPPGTVIGDSVLIGCLSAPPPNPADALREDTTWMGSPPIFLPQRQKSTAFPEETTFYPTTKLRVQRATIEFVRVITPSTCFIILISLLFSSLLLLHDSLNLLDTLLLFPFLYLGCALSATALTIVAKWVLVWRYRPRETPLWSTLVWRNELLNALHEHLAEPFLVGALTGTPFVCWYFRLLGANIGHRVYMETTDLSEFDMVRVGDQAALNADCTIQTHLFEDRVMKMSTIDIAPRCKVGAGSLVLYDTRLEEGAALGDLSLLMKGETLPAWTSWQGIPALPESRLCYDAQSRHD
jgi:amino acid adenylation domain-containing protein